MIKNMTRSLCDSRKESWDPSYPTLKTIAQMEHADPNLD